jgi:glyoxylase-like metal-dependent hydrolase (beta-lactamase superfamily II)
MTEATVFAGGVMSRREALRHTAWAGLGVTSALAGAGALEALLGQAPQRVDESSSRIGWPSVTPLPPVDERYPVMPTWKTELRQLAPNVYVYQQQGGTGLLNAGISNAGLFVGEDGLVALDALGFPLQTKAFIAAAEKATGGKPFAQLINTHHHGDHVAGNQFFLPAQILSHPYCRQEVLKAAPNTPASWPKQEGLADGTEVRKLTPPSVTFEDNMTYYIGGNEVQFRFAGPAHTWGDLVAYLPQHKILFAGDVAFFHLVPYAHNAHVSKWLESIDKIMKMDVDVIVPGHGPVGGKKDLAEMAEYFRFLKTEAKRRYDFGMSAGAAAADIKMGKFDNWMGPVRICMNTVRLYDVFKGTLTPVIDMEGTKRAIEEYNSIKANGKKRA